MARAVVTHQVSDDLFHLGSQFTVGFVGIALVVKAGGIHLLTIIADQDDAMGPGIGLAVATELCPQRTTATLPGVETEPAAFEVGARIGDAGGEAVGAGERAPILGEFKLIWGKEGGALVVGQQGRRELRLPVAHLGDQGTGLATAGSGVISEAASASSLDGVRS